MTISILETTVLLVMSIVSSGAYADAWSDGGLAESAWSENMQVLHVAGSGDNPWALPQQTNKAKPKGPAYRVNPHYVTPDDIKADSLDETVPVRRPRRRGPSSTDTLENYYNGRQQGLPSYGMNYVPGYAVPGYGGYGGGYGGGFPGMYDGAPGFGGDPLLYPYGTGVDLGDPYNLMMQPYSTGIEGDGD